MTRTVLRLSGGLLIVAVLAALAIMIRTPTTDVPTPLAERPRHADAFRPVFFFEDLPTMLATSDAVVRGRVTDVRVVGEGGADEARYEVHHVTVQVDEVYRGDAGASVTIEEDGVDTAYSLAGDEGTFFLWQRRDRPEGVFRLTSFQGRYLRGTGGDIQESGLDSELSSALEGMTEAQLEAAIHAALPDVLSGKVAPLEP